MLQMLLIQPDASNHTDIRTPLEKDLGVRPPGVYRPDGSFVPTRMIREHNVRKAFVDALRAQGAKVEEDGEGGLTITPPYPPEANRAVRRKMDALWQKRLNDVLSNSRPKD